MSHSTPDTPLKQCSRKEQCINIAGCWLPATAEYFRSRKSAKDGLRNWCRVCLSAYESDYRKEHEEKNREYMHTYYLEHKEQLFERNKRWIEEHPEQVREYKRKYQRNNPFKKREYYLANREKVLTKTRAYAKAHPDPARKRARKYKRLGIVNSIEGHYTKRDVIAQAARQRGKCFWCDCKLDADYHVDHVIPISRGGTNYPSNLVVACPFCNLSKGNKLPHEWQGSNGRLL